MENVIKFIKTKSGLNKLAKSDNRYHGSLNVRKEGSGLVIEIPLSREYVGDREITACMVDFLKHSRDYSFVTSPMYNEVGYVDVYPTSSDLIIAYSEIEDFLRQLAKVSGYDMLEGTLYLAKGYGKRKYVVYRMSIGFKNYSNIEG